MVVWGQWSPLHLLYLCVLCMKGLVAVGASWDKTQWNGRSLSFACGEFCSNALPPRLFARMALGASSVGNLLVFSTGRCALALAVRHDFVECYRLKRKSKQDVGLK